MPIAKVRLSDGRIARFNVSEGTTPEQVTAFAEANLDKLQSMAPTPAPIPEQAQSSHMQAPDQMQASHTPAPLPEQMRSRSPVEGTSFFDKAGNDIMDRMGKIGEFADSYGGAAKATYNAPAIGAVAAGQTALAAGDIAMHGASSLAKSAYGLLPEDDQKFIGDTAKSAGRKIANSPVGQFGAKVAKKGYALYEDLKDEHPKEAIALESMLGLAAVPFAQKGVRATKAGATDLAKAAIASPPVKKAKQFITDNAPPVNARENAKYIADKALKAEKLTDKTSKTVLAPAVSKQKATPNVKAYKKDTRAAVAAIVEHKKDLKFVDEYGDLASRVPKNADEFQEAIDTTKRVIWKKIEAKSKKAESAEVVRPFTNLKDVKKGERIVYANGKATGVASKEPFQIDGDKAANALDNIINDEAIQLNNENLIEYAKKRQAIYAGKKLTPTVAQNSLKSLNNSTKAFWADKSTKNYNKMVVDVIIANNLRKDLNRVIDLAAGEGYAPLRQQYKALKTIEQEVARVAAKERKQIKGLVMPSFTDVIASHQMVTGLASANLPKLLGGGFLGGVSQLKKLMRDPNRQIEKMFKAVDNSVKAANR